MKRLIIMALPIFLALGFFAASTDNVFADDGNGGCPCFSKKDLQNADQVFEENDYFSAQYEINGDFFEREMEADEGSFLSRVVECEIELPDEEEVEISLSPKEIQDCLTLIHDVYPETQLEF